MAGYDDDGGDGGEEDLRAACETGQQKKDKKRSRSPKAPTPPPATSQEEHRATSSVDDGLDDEVRAMVQRSVRQMLALKANGPTAAEIMRSLTEERAFSFESTFGDSDDGSLENVQARKVALLVSKSIVSLSSFGGGKRIRVCSGFVMRETDNTGTRMILTSATLVRSLNGDNNLISDVTVKVLLSDGHITDGHIFFVNFHYNVVVVKVAADLPLFEVSHVEGTKHNGAVLALGRAYEGGNLMCSRGQIVNRTSIFGCSELMVSSCEISMAGSGGPLVDYNGQVLGINFYETNQTSLLPILIISRILEQHQSFGKIISPWLGLRYTSLELVPLGVLERIYQKFPDVDHGLYITKVAKGSPADIAGFCVGDVLVKCGEKVISSAPEFGAMLLDACKELLESFGDCAGENMIVEVVIKKKIDGRTVSKSITAGALKECHYNRWPAQMPIYKPRVIKYGSW